MYVLACLCFVVACTADKDVIPEAVEARFEHPMRGAKTATPWPQHGVEIVSQGACTDEEHAAAGSCSQPHETAKHSLSNATEVATRFAQVVNDLATHGPVRPREKLQAPVYVIGQEDVTVNYGAVEDRSPKEYEALITRGMVELVRQEHEDWTMDKVEARVRGLNKEGDEYKNMRGKTIEILKNHYDLSEQGGWDHWVHVALYDLRKSFYDPHWHEPAVYYVHLPKFVDSRAQADRDKGQRRDVLLEAFTGVQEIVVRAKQTNELTQNREEIIHNLTIRAIEQAEEVAESLCNSTECKTVFHVEASSHSHLNIDCQDGSVLYRQPAVQKDGSMGPGRGSSMTLIAARIVPRDQMLRPALYQHTAAGQQNVNAYLKMLLTSNANALTKFSDDLWVYDKNCFLVPAEHTLNFRTPVKM
jgi:hypothetical protein